MLSERGCIQDDALKELAKYADLIECECPSHLLAILKQVREFSAYTAECITKYPKDAPTHKWLLGAAGNVDSLLSNTTVQLARMEGFIDEGNKFVPRADVKKAE